MRKLVQGMGALLVFVGTIGIVTPMCWGWFYSPKKPDIL